MQLSVDVAGDRQVARRLLRFGEAARDARPAFRQIRRDLERMEERQFDSQGGRASGGWAPLAPSTFEAKARRGDDLRILRLTGALHDSLTGGGSGATRLVAPDLLVFGTTVPYAKYHQAGTPNMPQRRPLELTARDRRDVVKTLQRFITTGQVG